MSELSTQLAASLPPDPGSGPEWVRALRNSGAEQFRAHGLPDRKDEAWKYTRLGVLENRDIQLAVITGGGGFRIIPPRTVAGDSPPGQHA